MDRPLYKELSSLIQARNTCNTSNNQEWFKKHTETIHRLTTAHLPQGWSIELDRAIGTGTELVSHADKLVFEGSYHHMNDVGYWDGWTDHIIVLTPSLLSDFNLRISGRNRNEIKDFLHDIFDTAMREDVTYDLYSPLFPECQVTSKWEDENGNPSQCYQAWYVGEPGTHSPSRFWNDLAGAKKYAGEQAYKKFMSQK